MKRHLIWIIAGAAAIGVAVPAFAAVQPSATPDDNGIPGEVRGNCDEAEHANDPGCLIVTVPAPTTVQVTAPSNTSPVTVPSNTTAGTVPSNTMPDNTTVGTVPDHAGGTVSSTSTVGTGPSNSVPGDISGPCDEAEHANDPRCSGAAPSGDDGSGDDSGRDDDSGHSGDDDSSGHGGGDDSGHGGDDDSSGHGSDDD